MPGNYNMACKERHDEAYYEVFVCVAGLFVNDRRTLCYAGSPLELVLTVRTPACNGTELISYIG